MTKDALEIVFVDRVEDAAAAALLDDPQHRLGGVVDRRLEAAALRDVAEALAVERMIPVAARQLHVVRIAAAALLGDEARRLLAQLVAHAGRLQPLEHRLAPALERVRRHQRRLNARRRRGVGILIDGRVDAARARLVHELQACRPLVPQFFLPITLWCVICVGRPPFSPISIVSLTLSRTPFASSRMCEM